MTSKQKPADSEHPGFEYDENTPIDQPLPDQPDQGVIQNVLLLCADLLPDRDRTWPTRHIGSQPQGFKVTVGSVAGIVHGCERKTVDYKGKPLVSIWLHGSFVATVRATGEILEAITFIPPTAFAEKIERALKEQGEGAKIQIDLDVGVESTGRTISYRWFTIDYSDSEERNVALGLAAKHKARLQLPQRLLGKTGN